MKQAVGKAGLLLCFPTAFYVLSAEWQITMMEASLYDKIGENN